MEIGKVHHHTPQTRKKGQGQWTQTIKGVGVENPQIFLRFLSLEICFPEKNGYESPHWCWVKLGFTAMCFQRPFTCPQICLLWSWWYCSLWFPFWVLLKFCFFCLNPWFPYVLLLRKLRKNLMETKILSVLASKKTESSL